VNEVALPVPFFPLTSPVSKTLHILHVFCARTTPFVGIKARLHRRFLSQQLDAFCRAQGCNFKIAGVNQVRFLVRFVAAISQGFRTCLKLDAILARQKLHQVAATKYRLCKRALSLQLDLSVTFDR